VPAVAHLGRVEDVVKAAVQEVIWVASQSVADDVVVAEGEPLDACAGYVGPGHTHIMHVWHCIASCLWR
jgi:hypothetical protein